MEEIVTCFRFESNICNITTEHIIDHLKEHDYYINVNIYNLNSIQDYLKKLQRLDTFVNLYRCRKNIVSLYEMEMEFCYQEGISSYHEYGLGTCFHHSNSVAHCFPSFSHNRKGANGDCCSTGLKKSVFKITSIDVIEHLKRYKSQRYYEDRSASSFIDLDAFLWYIVDSLQNATDGKEDATSTELKNNIDDSSDIQHPSELGVSINHFGWLNQILRKIDVQERKQMVIMENQLEKTMKNRLFQVSKSKFSIDNMENIHKRTSASEVNRILLSQATKFDMMMDGALQSQTQSLSKGYMRKIANRDQVLRNVVSNSGNKVSARTKIVVSVMCSAIAKMELLLQDLVTHEEEECDCCCVGKDSCSCKCTCECHQDSDDDSEDDSIVPIKKNATSNSMHSRQQDIIKFQLLLDKISERTTFQEFLKIIKQEYKSNWDIPFKDALEVILKRKWIAPKTISPQPMDLRVHRVIQGYLACIPKNTHQDAIVDSVKKVLQMHFQVADIHTIGIASHEQLTDTIDNAKDMPSSIVGASIIAMNDSKCSKVDMVSAIEAVGYMVDLSSALQWNNLFYPSFGCLAQFIVREVKDANFIEMQYGRILRYDAKESTSSFLDHGLRNKPLRAAQSLFSIFVKSNGVTAKSFPQLLLEKHFKHVLQHLEMDSIKFAYQFFITSQLPPEIGQAFFVMAIKWLPDIPSNQNVLLKFQELAAKSEKDMAFLRVYGLVLGIHAWQTQVPILTLNNHSVKESPPQQPVIKVVDSKHLPAPKSIAKLASTTTAPKSVAKISKTLSSKVEIVERIRLEHFGIGKSSSHSIEVQKFISSQHERLERALHRLSDELYASEAHCIYELLQNADDNTYNQVEPTISIHIYADKIIVKNNEIGFTEQNVRALCDIGASSKVLESSKPSIGKKGIGFKSVFKLTDSPRIHSNGFHIEFRALEKPLGYIVPHCIEPENESGTVILLPLKGSVLSHAPAMAQTFCDIPPYNILFLRQLKVILIADQISNTKVHLQKKIESHKLLSHGMEYFTISLTRNLEISNFKVFKQVLRVPASLQNSEHTDISLAFPEDSREVNFPVFAYLPLASYGLPFIVQADFIIPSSREAVDCDNEWNQWLISELPPLFVECISILRNPLSTFYLSFIPQQAQAPFKGMAMEIVRLLRDFECLPVASVHTNEFCTPNAGILFDADLNKLIPDEILFKILGKHWVQSSSYLDLKSVFLMEYFSLEHLVALAQDHRFNILGIEGDILRLLAVLFENLEYSVNRANVIKVIKSLPLFPVHGSLESISNGVIYMRDQCLSLDVNLRVLDPSIDETIQSDEKLLQFCTNVLGMQRLTLPAIMQHSAIPFYKLGKGDPEKTSAYLELVEEYYAFLGEGNLEKDDIWTMLKDIGVLVKTTSNDMVSLKSTKVYYPDEQWGTLKAGNAKIFSGGLCKNAFLSLGGKEMYSFDKVDVEAGVLPKGLDYIGSVRCVDIQCHAVSQYIHQLDAASEECQDIYLQLLSFLSTQWEPRFTHKKFHYENAAGNKIVVASEEFSTVYNQLRNTAWMYASRNSVTYKPHVPKEVWCPDPDAVQLFSCGRISLAPLAHMDSTFVNLESKLWQSLSVNTTITIQGIFNVLENLYSQVLPKFATMKQSRKKELLSSMHRIYLYLYEQSKQNEVISKAIVTAFSNSKLIFGTSSIPVDGKRMNMYSIKDCVWKDPFHVLEKGSSMQVLQSLYSADLQPFFVGLLKVSELPSVSHTLIGPLNSIKSLLHEDGNLDAIHNLLVYWQSFLEQGKLNVNDIEMIKQAIGTLSILPTLSEKVVTLQSNPQICDTSVLEGAYGVQFLNLNYSDTLRNSVPLLLRLGINSTCEDIRSNRATWLQILEATIEKLPFLDSITIVLTVFDIWGSALDKNVDIKWIQGLRRACIFPSSQNVFVCISDLFWPDEPRIIHALPKEKIHLAHSSTTSYPNIALLYSSLGIRKLSTCVEHRVDAAQGKASNDTIEDDLRLLRQLFVLSQRFVYTKHRHLFEKSSEYKQLLSLKLIQADILEVIYYFSKEKVSCRSKCTVCISDNILYVSTRVKSILSEILIYVCERFYGRDHGSTIANFLYVASSKPPLELEDWLLYVQGIPQVPQAVLNKSPTKNSNVRPQSSSPVAKKQRVQEPTPHDLTPKVFHTLDTLSEEARRDIGYWGEGFIYDVLVETSPSTDTVNWVNQYSESGKPYDIEIQSGHKRTYIEVKSTKTSSKRKFEFSLNELECARRHGSDYLIYRVYNAGQKDFARFEKFRNIETLIRSGSLKLLLCNEEQ